MANIIGRGRDQLRNEDELSTWDYVKGSIKPLAEQNKYLQDIADKKKAEKDRKQRANDPTSRALMNLKNSYSK